MENKKIMCSKKGQAAMEYLMTYGWAILAILIVLAILITLFGMIKLPSICNFPRQEFACDGTPQLYADDNNYVYINIKVLNNNPESVEIKKVACVEGNKVLDAAAQTSEKSLLSGETGTFLNIPCYDATGARLRMVPGSEFRGRFAVWYNLRSDPDKTVLRTTDATIVSEVAQKLSQTS
ncbi:MAG: hypothetical protein QXD51_03625 [Candidatus Anstonellales archaeon]